MVYFLHIQILMIYSVIYYYRQIKKGLLDYTHVAVQSDIIHSVGYTRITGWTVVCMVYDMSLLQERHM